MVGLVVWLRVPSLLKLKPSGIHGSCGEVSVGLGVAASPSAFTAENVTF